MVKAVQYFWGDKLANIYVAKEISALNIACSKMDVTPIQYLIGDVDEVTAEEVRLNLFVLMTATQLEERTLIRKELKLLQKTLVAAIKANDGIEPISLIFNADPEELAFEQKVNELVVFGSGTEVH